MIGYYENKRIVNKETGDSYLLSKYNTKKLKENEEVEYYLDYEYPTSCDNNLFCEGDEACIECFYANQVAIIKK